MQLGLPRQTPHAEEPQCPCIHGAEPPVWRWGLSAQRRWGRVSPVAWVEARMEMLAPPPARPATAPGLCLLQLFPHGNPWVRDRPA